MARALEAIIVLFISLSKTLIVEPWLPEPDWQELARVREPFFLINSFIEASMLESPRPDSDSRALEGIIFLLVPLPKTLILEAWLPEISESRLSYPDFQDLARAREGLI